MPKQLMVPPNEPEHPGQSLSSGAAGTTLLHIERARDRVGLWDTVHAWLKAAVREPVSAGEGSGLFYGAPAVAYALALATHPAYASVLRNLDDHISAIICRRLKHARCRIDRGEPSELREFDLINGLTGLGAYALLRERDDLLRKVLSYLVRLVNPLLIRGVRVPGWWSAHGPRDRPSPEWPDGHGNFGMAHGIGGPLSLLSMTMSRGVAVPGQPEAIAVICEAFDRVRTEPAGWPGIVSLSEWVSGAVPSRRAERPSWCYGTPGIARAQQLAGAALKDLPRARSAENTLSSCITDERQLALLTDASLCHGWAGLVQTVRRAAADADTDRLAGQIPSLAARMNRHLVEHGSPSHGGLLEGSTGILLVQQNLADDSQHVPPWDACLLLTGLPKEL